MQLAREQDVWNRHAAGLTQSEEHVLCHLSIEGGRVVHLFEVREEFLKSARLRQARGVKNETSEEQSNELDLQLRDTVTIGSSIRSSLERVLVSC